MNKLGPCCILGQDPLLNAVLGNAVEFPIVVHDVVALSTGNVLVFL